MMGNFSPFIKAIKNNTKHLVPEKFQISFYFPRMHIILWELGEIEVILPFSLSQFLLFYEQ